MGKAAPKCENDPDDPPAVLAHPMTHGRLAHVKGAGQVGFDDRLPSPWGDVLCRREELSSGVIHQPIQSPETLEHRLDLSVDLVLIANIAYLGQHLSTARLDRGAGVLQVRH